ncbi:hypothetical protein C8J55DRAFT_561149 [Lentinula edodes]|uniref:Uncharacterized protein n=1 Tax=Lentinula lateritia TaxID=40482 RepID=A0A9W9ACE1_9AGAR|nr:hypothetical protein C8J55DRAFT_561149 [Lentinula edodes]
MGGETGSNASPQPSLELLPPPEGSGVVPLDFLERTDPWNLYPVLTMLPSGRIFVGYYNEARILDPVTFDTVQTLPSIPGASLQVVHIPWKVLRFPFLNTLLLLNPPGSAQLTWLLDNPPGFWTIQLALSTAPEQNHPLFLSISYPIRCRSAPSINCALCTHFGKRAQNRRRMGQAYFTRLWTSAERSGNSATRTTSLEGEPSGTNSVRVPTVCGYLLFRSREGGGQNPYHISYWRLFARIDLELFVLNEKPSPGPSVSKLARPEFPERRASRYLDTSDVSTSEHLDIDDVSVSRCLDIDDVSTSRCPDIGYA